MHILFIHQNFPAQFGQIAAYLARNLGYHCWFASEQTVADSPEIRHVRFQPRGGAQRHSHYCSRTFENQIRRSHALFEALRQRPDVQPNLIVAHSGMVSSLFLRELYPAVPHIGYFEFFYYTRGSDMDFRHDLPPAPTLDRLRAQARNAQLLLDLENCDLGYSPTEFQRSQLPAVYQPRIRTIFDGIDTDFWHPMRPAARRIAEWNAPEGQKVVTYVSRGFESIRGFDLFLQVADRLCRERRDITVAVVGEDRIAYGGDARFTAGKSFKDWAVERHRPDLSRIHFLGRLPPSQLNQLLSLSDLHLYWTVPFVLSWSLMNALSCGCVVLASDTAPVREMISHGRNGLLADFFDLDAWVAQGLDVLERPGQYAPLRAAARERIERQYALPVCLEQMLNLYQQVRP
jgi:glycosyltransferase involved in cell wall biosynthesis